MSTNDDNVRVPLNADYGHAKTVSFPGEIGHGPKAHIPGQPAERSATTGRPVAVTEPAFSVQGAVVTLPNVTPEQAYILKAGSTQKMQFKALHASASVPKLGSATAAGYDLTTPEQVVLKPGQRTTIKLGFAVAIPETLHGRIESRSGLALKGLVVLTGVIDADYRGELMVIMQNFSDSTHTFAAGDRVAQLVLRPTVHVAVEVVEALSDTARGSGGFGSTGA
jgi:dUTP pyrophosphatase